MIFAQPVKVAQWSPYLGQQQSPPPAALPSDQASDLTRVPPFGLPMVQTGILMMAGGLVSGSLGIYLAQKGAKVIGKKIPTFWQFVTGTGGVGVAMAILGAIPLVALGAIEIAGGIIIQKKLQEAVASIPAPSQK